MWWPWHWTGLALGIGVYIDKYDDISDPHHYCAKGQAGIEKLIINDDLVFIYIPKPDTTYYQHELR